MWIRSQNKGVLIDVNTFHIEVEPEHNKHSIYGNSRCLLGEFDTRERAFQILDNIQSDIQIESLYKYNQEAANCYGGDFSFIYEMPRE